MTTREVAPEKRIMKRDEDVMKRKRIVRKAFTGFLAISALLSAAAVFFTVIRYLGERQRFRKEEAAEEEAAALML